MNNETRNLLLLISGSQLQGFGRTLEMLDADNRGMDDLVGALLVGTGAVAIAQGTGNLRSVKQGVQVIYDVTGEYLANLGEVSEGPAPTGRRSQLLVVVGGQLRAFGATLKALDPDSKGTDDLIGAIAQAGGVVLVALGANGNVRDERNAIQAIHDAAGQWLADTASDNAAPDPKVLQAAFDHMVTDALVVFHDVQSEPHALAAQVAQAQKAYDDLAAYAATNRIMQWNDPSYEAGFRQRLDDIKARAAIV